MSRKNRRRTAPTIPDVEPSPCQHEGFKLVVSTRQFTTCVAPGACNRAAHGGQEHSEVCTCGAIRRSLVNGCNVEVGPWKG
jgi:hypothetical protein